MSPAAPARRRAPLLVGGVLAASSALVFARDPHQGGYGFCPILALTGFACPSCGGLRAAHDLLHGDLAGAWSMNPLLTIALPLAALAWVVWAVRALRGAPARRVPVWIPVGLLALAVAFGVLRNVPALMPALTPWLL